jgi:phage-related tail fiber protein
MFYHLNFKNIYTKMKILPGKIRFSQVQKFICAIVFLISNSKANAQTTPIKKDISNYKMIILNSCAKSNTANIFAVNQRFKIPDTEMMSFNARPLSANEYIYRQKIRQNDYDKKQDCTSQIITSIAKSIFIKQKPTAVLPAF